MSSAHDPAPRSFIAELRRRYVFRVAGVYAAVAFVVLQVADLVVEPLALPRWIMPALIVVTALGFPLALVLAWAFEITSEGIRRTDALPVARDGARTGAADDDPVDAAPLAPGRRRVPRRVALVGAGAVIVLVLAVGAWIGLGAVRASDGGQIESVAVLPFVDLSAAGDQQYLSDGLTEELLGALARVPGLRVASRSSSFQFRGAQVDVRDVGRRLGVAAVIEGSVRRSGNRLRISAQLVDAASGYQLWSEEYEREVADLFALQDEIAGRIAARLDPTRAEDDPLMRRQTESIDAYDRFLRGNFLLAKRSPGPAEQAIEEYRAAARIDPRFVAPLAREAYAYALFVDWGWRHRGATSAELIARGLALSERALALDSSSADAWMARAYLLVQSDPYRMGGAVGAFERAIALDPANVEAWHQYGQTLMVLGRYDEARSAYQRVLALAPERAMSMVPLAAIALRQKRMDEAARWRDSAVATDPSLAYPYVVRSLFLSSTGDAEAARRDADVALRLDPEYTAPARAARALALVTAGDTAAARREIVAARAALQDPETPSSTEGYFVALALVAAGEAQEALDLLERVDPRGALFWFLLQSPELDAVRAHPRFRALVAEADPRDDAARL